MEKEMRKLKQSAHKLGIELSARQLDQFDSYQQELLRWNAKTNLISEKSAQEIVSRHFLDSLTALKFIAKPDARIIDIGCGAGFPGLPLKITSPDLKLYLVETNRKKVSFLKHVVRVLKISDTFVLHDRVENLLTVDRWKDFFDVLISRAAFKLPEMLPWGAFFLATGGEIVALKGKDLEREFLQGTTSAQQYGFGKLFQYDINQEAPDITRKIIVGHKTI
jgi:16S rRNA (guanine527-N7)-methyltransferase